MDRHRQALASMIRIFILENSPLLEQMDGQVNSSEALCQISQQTPSWRGTETLETLSEL